MTAVTMTAPAGTGRRTGTGTGQLAGTWALLRLALRRDRIIMPLWVIVLGGSFSSVGKSISSLYATESQRAELAASMNGNSSLRAMYGPVFSDSVGGLVSWRMIAFGAALAAVMSLVVVVRHTREEEETGRQEMLSSAVVGRRAPLTAALLAAVVANAALALVIMAGMAGSGAGGAGAVAIALAVAGVGVLFACTAAIAAQFTESARLAKGLTASVIGAAFVLKAAGDSATDDGSSVFTWLSPIGWAENVRPYADERWWVLLVIAGAVAVQCAAAYALTGRRDVGMSFLATRPGPARGRISTAFGLAVRLQRGALLGWTVSFAAVGAVFGGLTGGAADLVGDNEKTREIFERMGGQAGLTDAFLASMVSVLGTVAALYIVSSVLRPHGEETAGLAEPVLAGGVGRIGWAAGHLLIAFGGAALIMVAGGLGLAAGYGHELPAVLGAALIQLPAVWLLGGVTALLYGTLPKAAPAAWGLVGICLALGWIGPALDLPQPVMDLSPFTHLPKLPGAELVWGPAVLLTVLAAALTAGGLAALRRRDMLN
ncbi:MULTISPECIES: ABC transporter permease [unclassified Streptomyces]|uniref:ABC transporter permease n=1 Tax=unclassified Streptomyces TaxID=2593676 RepID=UPI002E14161E|nr:ABC transporter permease [Streptomyces sp. NBC_01324]